MTWAVIIVATSFSAPAAAAPPQAPPVSSRASQSATASDKLAEAYAQFLLAHRLAEQALKLAPTNREANRVLGLVYAALSENGRENRPRAGAADRTSNEYATKAIDHLERAIDRPVGESDPNVRATLSRLYLRTRAFDKAVRLLTDLVNQEPGWQDGPMLLVEAYAGAGRTADAIGWLEQHAGNDPRLLPVLADFYERDRRWKDAADAYGRALQRAP